MYSILSSIQSNRFLNLAGDTKDSFLLAARLVLAGKCWGREGILLIDEPFQALDRARTERALRLIKKFIEQNGWQVIIFSKEEELMTQAEIIFPGIKVHLLELQQGLGEIYHERGHAPEG